MSSGALYGDNSDDDGFGDGDTEHEAEGIADGSLAPDETVRKNYFSRPLKCDDGQSFNREKVGKNRKHLNYVLLRQSHASLSSSAALSTIELTIRKKTAPQQ